MNNLRLARSRTGLRFSTSLKTAMAETTILSIAIKSINRPYSRRGHDGQKDRLGLQIYRKFARQYVNCDVTSLLLHVPVM